MNKLSLSYLALSTLACNRNEGCIEDIALEVDELCRQLDRMDYYPGLYLDIQHQGKLVEVAFAQRELKLLSPGLVGSGRVDWQLRNLFSDVSFGPVW